MLWTRHGRGTASNIPLSKTVIQKDEVFLRAGHVEIRTFYKSWSRQFSPYDSHSARVQNIVSVLHLHCFHLFVLAIVTAFSVLFSPPALPCSRVIVTGPSTPSTPSTSSTLVLSGSLLETYTSSISNLHFDYLFSRI